MRQRTRRPPETEPNSCHPLAGRRQAKQEGRPGGSGRPFFLSDVIPLCWGPAFCGSETSWQGREVCRAEVSPVRIASTRGKRYLATAVQPAVTSPSSQIGKGDLRSPKVREFHEVFSCLRLTSRTPGSPHRGDLKTVTGERSITIERELYERTGCSPGDGYLARVRPLAFDAIF